MTGGEVLYVNCLDHYRREPIPNDGASCDVGDLCGLSAFPAEPVVLKFRCTKKLQPGGAGLRER